MKFEIERLFPMNGDWMNFKVMTIFKIDPGYKKTKIGSVWRMVSKKRKVYNLSFNGKELAEGHELNSFRKDYPKSERYQLAKMKKIYHKHMAIDPDADDYKKPIIEEEYDPDNDPDYDPSESVDERDHRIWIKKNPRKPGQRF